MSEFNVTLSAMSSAAKNIGTYTNQFKSEADETYQAAKTLGESWVGDASATFAENMEQLHRWMDEMVAVLETYSAMLNKSRDEYETTDVNAVRNFSGR